ncbi:MAG TPA: DUF6516 family protein [Stellaceae bacterium]|nr:DUF6516 family protein [Stellaceae bacterium]
MIEPRDPTPTGRCSWWTRKAGHWVRFVVKRVPVSPQKPHGIDYSLTMHGPEGEWLVGFDNAHPVGRRKRREPQDHRHRLRSIRPYHYWEAVDAVLRERGVIPRRR